LKVSVKQPSELQDILNSLVRLEINDNIVTITKNNKTIATLNPAVVTKGDKGKIGSRGLYPWELAGFEDQESFDDAFAGQKGPTGNQGIRGYKGPTGDPAQPSTTDVKIVTTKGLEPSFVLNNKKEFVLTMPLFEDLYEQPFWKFVIDDLNVKKGDTFSAHITWNDNERGTLDITLPIDSAVIKTGNVNQTVENKIGQVKTVVKDSQIPGSFWSCTKAEDQDSGVTTYNFLLSAAAKGEKGPTGERGWSSIVTNTLKSHDSDVSVGFGAFSFDDNGFSFFLNSSDISFTFKNQNGVWTKEVKRT